MAVLVTCESLSKSYSARPLFSGISFTIDDRDTIGLIGPNGSGKSTLMKIIAGLVEPDDGSVMTQKFLKVAYVAQEQRYEANETLLDIVMRSLDSSEDEFVRKTKAEVILSKVGFNDSLEQAGNLSGGWRKRLAIAAELVKEPDFLLLDEPTNHLDLEGVLWLEDMLKSANYGYVVVSHDRSFLENVSNRIIDLNPIYRDGYLSVKGKYSDFLEAKEQYVSAQANEQQALASKVRREIAWLQRGARARQTKAQGRIREAGNLIQELEEVKFRNRQTTAVDIDFNASGRKTKELLVCKGLSKSLGGRLLFQHLDLVITPGQKLGLLGTNGSGKTTLLRLLAGELQPDKGTVKRAADLKVVWFDQNRDQLDRTQTLRDALSPTGDQVVYRGRSVHVASWSKRFLFRPDQLNMPVSYLSGGEQARILIARLMLQPADILILDEPTNDLDIPSLEVLEESLEDFPGAVVLVTHDRMMLDTISTHLLALDGHGGVQFFADYAQWESLRPTSASALRSRGTDKSAPSKGSPSKDPPFKPLSTNEKKELEQMAQRIEAAEAHVAEVAKRLEDPAIATNHVKLQAGMDELHKAQAAVAKLYERWEDLERRSY
jgi:ABC transport system ATP-binding/permease protein